MQKLIHDLAEQGFIKKSNEITIMDRYIVTPVKYPAPQGRCGCFGGPKVDKNQDPVNFFIWANSELTFRDWLPMLHDLKKDDYFCMVNRNLDILRLSGVNCIIEEKDEFEAVVTMTALLSIEGAQPDLLIVPKESKISDKVKFRNVYSSCTVIKSDDLNDNEYLLLTSNTWVKYPNTLSCHSPGYNGRFLINKE